MSLLLFRKTQADVKLKKKGGGEGKEVRVKKRLSEE